MSSFRDLWDNFRWSNIGTTTVSEGEERERENETQEIFEEIMAENFTNLMKNINLQSQEAQ